MTRVMCVICSGWSRGRRPEYTQIITEAVMRANAIAKVAALIVAAAFAQSICLAQTVVDSDFSKGDFAALGWKAKGDWDVFRYPKEAANNPGPVGPFRGQQARRLPDQDLRRDQESQEAVALPGLRLGLGRCRPGRRRGLVHAPGCQGQRLCLRGPPLQGDVGGAVGQGRQRRSSQGQDLGARGDRRQPRVGSRRRRLEPPDDHARIRRGLDHRQQGLEQRRRRDGEVHRRHDELVQPVGSAGHPELR